jgi:multidrug resistance efflux pump
MYRRKRMILWSSVVGALLILGAVAALALTGMARRAHARGSLAPTANQEEPQEPDGRIPVKVVRPRRDLPEFVRTTSQPGPVHAFYKAEVMSRVAGPVKWVYKNIGDAVVQGEPLVVLDVPDLERDVAEKEALVKQATQEVRAAEAAVPIAEAAAREAEAQIGEMDARVVKMEANRVFHEKELDRFRQLANREGVSKIVVDEKIQELETARADLLSAQAAVKVAKANADEFKGKVQAARVDVDVKKARQFAAQAALAHAQTLADYTVIPAPFNGRVVARNVDPGTFVQSANSGKAVPMLSIERTDLVTIVIWVPEKDAPYVSADTEVVIRLDALDGREIRTRVTRIAHALDPEKGRDMQVQVDLYNPHEPGDYPAVVAKAIGRFLAPLGNQRAEGALVLLGNEQKEEAKGGVIRPGFYGYTTLILQRFENAPLLPSSAVFERGGRTYLFEVIDGHAKLVPVRVQLEDGALVKVVKLVRRHNPKTGHVEEVAEELTGDEEIIRSGQGEITDGQAVNATHVDW